MCLISFMMMMLMWIIFYINLIKLQFIMHSSKQLIVVMVINYGLLILYSQYQLLCTQGIREMTIPVYSHGGMNITGLCLVDPTNQTVKNFIRTWSLHHPEQQAIFTKISVGKIYWKIYN